MSPYGDSRVLDQRRLKAIKIVDNGLGPGEAADADVGIAAAGDGSGTLFRHGKPVRRVPESAFVAELLAEINLIAHERRTTLKNSDH